MSEIIEFKSIRNIICKIVITNNIDLRDLREYYSTPEIFLLCYRFDLRDLPLYYGVDLREFHIYCRVEICIYIIESISGHFCLCYVVDLRDDYL